MSEPPYPPEPPYPYRPGYYRRVPDHLVPSVDLPPEPLLTGLIVDTATGRPPAPRTRRRVSVRTVARVVLVAAAVGLLAVLVTADDRAPIDLPPSPSTVWVRTTVYVPAPPAPAPLVEAIHPTGATT